MNKEKQIDVLIKSSVLGALRGIIGLPYQHPFDTLKTVMQSKQFVNPIKAAKFIYTNYGIMGFYSGFVPNTIRVGLKQVYRFPMMIYLPNFIKNQYSNIFKKQMHSSQAKAATGLTIAFSQVFVLNPAERLKVWLMTRNVRQQNLRFFFSHSTGIWKDLFKGLNGTFYKQAASWISFLVADDIIKKQIRKYKNVPETEQLRYHQLLLLSFGVGIVNTLCIMPFDLIKTTLQKDGAIKQSSIAIISHAFKTGGFNMLYTGWQVRLTHYMIQSILTVGLYDYLETSFKRTTIK